MMGEPTVRKKDFDNIFQGGKNGTLETGRFKLSEAGLGWKNASSGQILTVPSAEIDRLQWIRVAKDYQIRVSKKDGSVLKFDGFSKDSFDGLNSVCKSYYQIPLEVKEMSLRGYNWGQADFSNDLLQFSVKDKMAFEIPLSDVTNTSLGGKNEVSVEMTPSQERHREDLLMEIRFYVPGNVTAGQVDDSQGKRAFKDRKEQHLEGEEEGEINEVVLYDEDGEALTAASLFCDTIKQKADFVSSDSEAIVSFTDILCLVPRGRFTIEMHDSFLRLRGKSQDFKILFTSIKRMFMLPKPDDMHYSFVVGLDPPLRQGQTRYPFLVFQLGREDNLEANLNLSEEELEKYQGKLNASYDGPIHQVVNQIFSNLIGKKIAGTSSFKSAQLQSCIKCSIKANEALLYPLEKGFLSIPKPPIYFSLAEIAAVTFARVSTTTASTKTFEAKFNLTNGTEHLFSSIPKEEYNAIEGWCRSKNITVRTEIADFEDAEESKRRVDYTEEMESESDDEDFASGSSSESSEDSDDMDEDEDDE